MKIKPIASNKSILTILLSAGIAMLSGLAYGQLALNDGDFETDAFLVTNFGTNHPRGKLLPSGTFWTGGNSNGGILDPTTDPVAPLSGNVGLLLGFTAFYQSLGTLEADTTYTISFTFQTFVPVATQFRAALAYDNGFGQPSSLGDIAVGSGPVLSATSQDFAVNSVPQSLTELGALFSAKPTTQSPSSRMGEIVFTTSSDVTADNVFLYFEGPDVNAAAYIDNVSLQSVAVPEPATGALLLIGGASLSLISRRRRAVDRAPVP